MSAVAGKVCVVTGAGSGIGRALAVELARRGARLALSDVDEAGLAETAAMLDGADVHTARLDVADRDAFAAYVDEVVEHFKVVHQVYNNAGVAFSRTVLESDWADYERVFGVNLWGVLHGTKLFLPHVIASGDGHVINISSLNGYTAQPEMSHYVTTKFAVRGFTETLRTEMLKGRHPVGVTVVHPGGIRTNIANRAFEEAKKAGLPVTPADEERRKVYNEKLLKMDPAKAATTIVDAVQADKPRVLVGSDAKAVELLVRLFPGRYPLIMAALEKRLMK